jgi:hypothetical protein
MRRLSDRPFDPRDPLLHRDAAPAGVVPALVPYGQAACVLAFLGLLVQMGHTRPLGCHGPDVPLVATAGILGFTRAHDVEVDRRGLVYLRDRPVPTPDALLRSGVAALRAGPGPHRPLLLVADASAPYDRVLLVMEAAAAAGAGEVVLVTAEPRRPAAGGPP